MILQFLLCFPALMLLHAVLRPWLKPVPEFSRQQQTAVLLLTVPEDVLLLDLGAAHQMHLEVSAAPEDVLLGDVLLPDLGVSACFPVLPSRSYCFEDGTPE